jgi:hypothetical protein
VARGGPASTTLLAVAAARWPDRAAVMDDDGTARYSDLTQTAQRLHAAAGGEDSPTILFSIDEDIDLNTWKCVAVDWFRGLNSCTGRGPHRRLWAFPGVSVGDRRRRNWALKHCRAPVGVADERVVAW